MLLCIFENYHQFGCKEFYEYLSGKFSTHLINLIDNPDPTPEIEKLNPSLILTTSPLIAISTKKPTILYLVSDISYLDREKNTLLWRSISAGLSSLFAIFSNSMHLARTFSQTFKHNSKVQYFYVPQKMPAIPKEIKYDLSFPFLFEFQDQNPTENFSLCTSPEDLKSAKLFLYYPENDESANFLLPTAASYGVPMLGVDWSLVREMSSPGDILISDKASVAQWLYQFRNLLRDREIASEKSRNFSKRYIHMSELEDKIKQALKEIKPKSARQSSFSDLQKLASQKTQAMLPKLFSRKVERANNKRPSMIINLRQEHAAVINFLNQHNEVYIGVGGIGDALLTIAGCFNKPDCHVIHSCNGGVEDVIKNLFELFDIKVLAIPNLNGSMEGLQIFQQIWRHPNFKGSFHVPERLNYFDWKVNTDKYLTKVINRIPLVDMFGKLENPRKTKGIVGIAPRGSDNQNMGRQRFLTQVEYNSLVSKWINSGYTVFSFGSEADLNHYAPFPDNNAVWFASNLAMSYPLPSYPISLKHMLKALNSCELVISVDSWVKTYTGLANIPTQVILTRCHGKPDLAFADPSDSIFLNRSLWNFEFYDISKLLAT